MTQKQGNDLTVQCINTIHNLHGRYIGERETFITLVSIVCNPRIVEPWYKQNSPQYSKKQPCITTMCRKLKEDKWQDEHSLQIKRNCFLPQLLDMPKLQPKLYQRCPSLSLKVHHSLSLGRDLKPHTIFTHSKLNPPQK